MFFALSAFLDSPDIFWLTVTRVVVVTPFDSDPLMKADQRDFSLCHRWFSLSKCNIREDSRRSPVRLLAWRVVESESNPALTTHKRSTELDESQKDGIGSFGLILFEYLRVQFIG